jgi:hypothetical protein
VDGLFYNSLTEGDFGNGFALRQSLVEGDFWPRLEGCYNLYGGQEHIDHIDYRRILTTVTTKGVFVLPNYISHEASTDYFYAIRCASCTGKEEKGTMAVVGLFFDAEGKIRPNRPNYVSNLCVSVAEGGWVRLNWYYWPIGQRVAPHYFAIYSNNGSGAIDYNNQMAEVCYTGTYFYSYLSGPIQENIAYRFGVRTVTDDGIDDNNSNWVEVTVNPSVICVVEDINCQVRF